MKKRTAIRAAVLSAATTAALLGSTVLFAHDAPVGKADEQMMMHQMDEVRAANRAMHQASPQQRDQAIAEHRHGMMHMMQMMRHMDGMGGMGDMPGANQPTAAGPGGMGMGMGHDDAPDPARMRGLSRRLDRMEAMMSEMLDHMDMYEQRNARR